MHTGGKIHFSPGAQVELAFLGELVNCPIVVHFCSIMLSHQLDGLQGSIGRAPAARVGIHMHIPFISHSLHQLPLEGL